MLLTRDHCVLLLIDLQHAFCSPEGDLARRGRDVAPMQAAARACGRLADAAHVAGVPVIWTRMMLRPDYADGGRMTDDLLPHLKAAGSLRRGTQDVALTAGLPVLPDDDVIDKPRNSALFGTSLEVHLNARRIERVIVGGVTSGDSDIESAEWEFPIQVCESCICALDCADEGAICGLDPKLISCPCKSP